MYKLQKRRHSTPFLGRMSSFLALFYSIYPYVFNLLTSISALSSRRISSSHLVIPYQSDPRM
jgi:hypothetical protein